MSKEFDRITREFEEGIALDLARTPVKVVVMGPALTDSSPAAKLRSDIITAAQDYGATIRPEHGGLIRAAARKLRKGHHLTAMEIQLVAFSDVVVMIPDSAGSLCELGLFATFREYGPKLLILASKKYPRAGSYVADGPLTAAKHNHAEVKYVDYEDTGKAWLHVERRLQRVQAELSMVRLSGGG